MYSPPAILPLLHLTLINMSKSIIHLSPSINYFMVPAPPPSQLIRLRGLLKTDSI
ncbi:MAG: hypothetical protein ACK55Z_26960 [bacterium]